MKHYLSLFEYKERSIKFMQKNEWINITCHTDICKTVLLFSLLLLHNRVMSDRNSFFTSSNCSVCFDCLINVATTFRITGIELTMHCISRGWELTVEIYNKSYVKLSLLTLNSNKRNCLQGKKITLVGVVIN